MTLLSFVQAIGRTRSFSGAARELGYSQAAISQRIRRFEATLGMPLFVRRPRGVEPTEAGQILLRRAVEALSTIELAHREIEALRNLLSGRVRILAFPSVSATVLPLAIAQLAASHPYLDISFREENPELAIDSLRAGAADIAIVYRYAGSSVEPAMRSGALVTNELIPDPLYITMARTHPLAGRARITLENFSDDTWIAGSKMGQVFSDFEQLGFTPKLGPDISDSIAAQAFVAEGLGVAIMPRLVILASHHPGIVVKQIRPGRERTIDAVTLRTTPEMPAIAATMAALKEAASSIAATEL